MPVQQYHTGAVPVPAGEDALLLLALLFPQQQGIETVGQVEGPGGGAGFGGLLHDGGAGSGPGLFDPHHPLIEVHIGPAQAADLLPTQAQAGGQLDHHLQPGAFGEQTQPAQVLRAVEPGFEGNHPGRLHPVSGASGQHVLFHRHAQGRGEQVMVPSNGIGGEALLPHEHGVIFLNVLGGDLLQGDVPQGGRDVVIDDLVVAVHRGLRPVGLDHLLHPVGQPLVQGNGPGYYLAAKGTLRLEFPKGFSGQGQAGEGVIGADAVSALRQAVVHVDVVELTDTVKGDVALNAFSRHGDPLFFIFEKSSLAHPKRKE